MILYKAIQGFFDKRLKSSLNHIFIYYIKCFITKILKNTNLNITFSNKKL